ncbi:uncharacterized protein F4817DRAFT_364836 [Daldinia loculata]|uniref:uncharacterized protein n=1 Tax=Daldinia loculata TaxID=103429 RepID=UPI0020C3E411|nr:uncharacterized protein F4817DRAFT_364836 [Daldinia loculata]KAI1651924.1 hypothetical protein F4817DRAFT_364836 [Daldinia loculata]
MLSVSDTTLRATFSELIVATTSQQYVIGTTMLFTNSMVTTIESIVAVKGDWGFDDSGGVDGYLHWTSLESWDRILKDNHDSRKVIQAAGDLYFDSFANENVGVPFGMSCARLEGRKYTDPNVTGGNTCLLGYPFDADVTNRRYIIDEELDTLNMYLVFPGLDRSRPEIPLPDNLTFRVEEGLIRYIHTPLAYVNAGCGLNLSITTQGHPPFQINKDL